MKDLLPGRDDESRQEEAFPRSLSDGGELGEGVVVAGQSKGVKGRKLGKGRGRTRGEESVRPGSRSSWTSSTADPLSRQERLLNKMCHTDVVVGERAGRTEGRRNKDILSVRVLNPSVALPTHGCVGCLHCSITKHTGLF